MASIDEKKSEIDKQNNTSNTKLAVIRNIASQFIHLGIIIVFGTGALYTCRAAQTNLFPTCVEFAPYTSVLPTFSTKTDSVETTGVQINSVETNVNIGKTGDEPNSTKMTFSIEENIKMMTNSQFFMWFRNLTEGPNSNQIKLYFGLMMQNILALNFTIINFVYQTINNILPEILIVLLMPFILIFIYFGLGFIDFFYVFYLVLANLYVFCLPHELSPDKNKTIWDFKEGNKIWEFKNWWKIIVAFFFYWIPLLIGWFLTPIAVIYSFFFPFMLKSTVKTDEGTKSYGISGLFFDVLKFNRRIFMFILSFYLILDMSSSFGAPAAVATLVIFILLFFFSEIYSKYQVKGADGVSGGLASFDPPTKTCGKLQEVEISSPSPSPSPSPIPSPSPNQTQQQGGWKNRS